MARSGPLDVSDRSGMATHDSDEHHSAGAYGPDRGVTVREPVQQGADMLAQLGRHWGWVLSYGIITLLAGIVVLAWPGATLLAIAVLFGIQLIVAGIFRFVDSFATEEASGGTRVLLALLGVLSIIIGLWAVRASRLSESNR